MKRKFGHTTIYADNIKVISVGFSDKGYGRIYTVTIKTFSDISDSMNEKEIRISKAEYKKLRKELHERGT